MLVFSGLGYIVSSYMLTLLGNWQWGLRVTPIFGALFTGLVILLMEEPRRGQVEVAGEAATAASGMQATSYWEDIKAIYKMYYLS